MFRNQLEFNMTEKMTSPGRRTCLGIAALTASVLLAGAVQAGSTFPITVKVNAAGLDLSQVAGIRALYSRLKTAADAVCGNAYRVGLQPVASYADCYEKALGAAVQSVNQTRLTLEYLGTHTLKDAAAHGIELPVHMASK
jgi:UrcA family protein